VRLHGLGWGVGDLVALDTWPVEALNMIERLVEIVREAEG